MRQTLTSARHLAPFLFLVGLLFLAYYILSVFLLPLAWAVILVYTTWPVYLKILNLCKQHATWAAVLASLMLAFTLILPLVWASFVLQAEIVNIYRALPHWLDQKPALPHFASNIPFLGKELDQLFAQADTLKELLQRDFLPWISQFSGQFINILGSFGHNIGVLGLTLLTTFFLYRDGPEVTRQVRTGLRLLLGGRLEGYLSASQQTLKAVVYGIVLTALGQSSLACIGYWFAGIAAPVLLGIFTFFLALIPFGTPLAWGTASLLLLLKGEYWAGIGLFLWGALVVSWIDNIIRPLVISGVTRIPFILVIFGILGGLLHFGFIGLFLGPVVLALGLAVWREWLGQQ